MPGIPPIKDLLSEYGMTEEHLRQDRLVNFTIGTFHEIYRKGTKEKQDESNLEDKRQKEFYDKYLYSKGYNEKATTEAALQIGNAVRQCLAEQSENYDVPEKIVNEITAHLIAEITDQYNSQQG